MEKISVCKKTIYEKFIGSKDALELLDFLLSVGEKLYLEALELIDLKYNKENVILSMKDLLKNFLFSFYFKVLGSDTGLGVLREAHNFYEKSLRHQLRFDLFDLKRDLKGFSLKLKAFKEVKLSDGTIYYRLELPKYLTDGDLFEDELMPSFFKELLVMKNFKSFPEILFKKPTNVKKNKIYALTLKRDCNPFLNLESQSDESFNRKNVLLDSLPLPTPKDSLTSLVYGYDDFSHQDFLYGLSFDDGESDSFRALSLSFGIDELVIGYLSTGEAFVVNAFPLKEIVNNYDYSEANLVESLSEEELLNQKLSALYYEFKVDVHNFYRGVVNSILTFCRENFVDLIVFGLGTKDYHQNINLANWESRFYLENMRLDNLEKLLRYHLSNAGFEVASLKEFNDAVSYHEHNSVLFAMDIYDLYLKEHPELEKNLKKTDLNKAVPFSEELKLNSKESAVFSEKIGCSIEKK